MMNYHILKFSSDFEDFSLNCNDEDIEKNSSRTEFGENRGLIPGQIFPDTVLPY